MTEILRLKLLGEDLASTPGFTAHSDEPRASQCQVDSKEDPVAAQGFLRPLQRGIASFTYVMEMKLMHFAQS